MINIIAAKARNGVIGNQNTIPWHLPEDFKHFAATTRGAVVVMGMRTWESLPKKPLPKRTNIIISRQGNLTEEMEDVHLVRSIEDALALAEEHGGEIFIIGGAEIYSQTMALADRLVISEIDLNPRGDTFFPEIGSEWLLVSETPREGFVIKIFEK